MRHALIDIDGTLAICAGPWEAKLGPEGQARVRLVSSIPVTGWVNDCGLLDQRTYPRNIVGSCVLGCLGAVPQPYAGPLVITGWHPSACPCGHELDLSNDWADYLRQLHADIRRVLGGEQPSDPAVSKTWANAVRAFADHIQNAPTPFIQFVRGMNSRIWGPN